MHKDTYERRFTLKLQIGHFLRMEQVCLIFIVDLASSLLLLV